MDAQAPLKMNKLPLYYMILIILRDFLLEMEQTIMLQVEMVLF